ncbi:MAG: pyrroline-5-carboxylate reductase [Paracoccaceae bacterium]
MIMDDVNARGLVLLGCGKMGSAMLAGWLRGGLAKEAVSVIDPAPSDWVRELAAKGARLNMALPEAPAICVIAVKPQIMVDALPSLVELGNGPTLFLSIAAGTPIAALETILGVKTPILRAMPNTPAAVGHGITALVGNGAALPAHLSLGETLLGAIGETVRLEAEAQMDAVTAVSGSGPAYVFHLIETLAAAGEAEGLAPGLAMRLALVTVAGAGDLAEKADEPPAELRANVTSPGGTTAAALGVLMDKERGFPSLMARAVAAAAARSRELGRG